MEQRLRWAGFLLGFLTFLYRVNRDMHNEFRSQHTTLREEIRLSFTGLKEEIQIVRFELKNGGESVPLELDGLRTQAKRIQTELQELNVQVARNDGTLQTLLQVMTDRRAA